jgi:hypothetical protein
VVDEDLDHYAQQIDNLVGRMDAIIELQQARNAITVTHTQSGMGGFATGICVASSIGAVVLSVVIAFLAANYQSRSYERDQVKVVLEMEQLKAWNDVTRKDIARLQAQQPEKH